MEWEQGVADECVGFEDEWVKICFTNERDIHNNLNLKATFAII